MQLVHEGISFAWESFYYKIILSSQHTMNTHEKVSDSPPPLVVVVLVEAAVNQY